MIFHLAYEALKDETALKAYDFGAATLARRTAQGEADMARQIVRWQTGVDGAPGLTIHDLVIAA